MDKIKYDEEGVLSFAFEAGPLTIIADGNRKIIKINDAALNFSGFPIDELMGSPLDELYTGQEDAGFLRLLNTGDLSGSSSMGGQNNIYSGETLRNTWEGSRIKLIETITLIRDSENDILYYVLNCQDVTRLNTKEYATIESDQSFEQLIELLPEAALVLDGVYIDACNEQFSRMMQRPKAEIVGANSAELSMQMQQDGVDVLDKLNKIITAVKRGREGTLEWILRLPNESFLEVEASFSGFDYHGRRLTFVNVRDITARKRMEKERYVLLDELAHNEQMTRLAINAGGIVLWEADVKTGGMSWSDGANKTFDLPSTALPAKLREINRLVFSKDLNLLVQAMRKIKEGRAFELESRFETPSGELRWFRTQGQVECDSRGDPIIVRAAVSNISDYKKAQQEISQLAYFDPLTTLANRRLLMDRLTQYCAAAKRNKTSGVVFYLDLDRFKLLNDSLGHASGDILLKEVAKRLLNVFRADDTVARIGGDEFVVVVPVIAGGMHMVAHKARVIADKLRATLAENYTINDHSYHMSSSIGLAIFPQDSDTAESVIQSADVAMYQAKKNGRNAVAFYRSDLQANADSRVLIEQDLRQAIKGMQFELHYQPKVNNAGIPVGIEALVRWQHPERGLVQPVEFIKIAEETGLIVDIGQWVAETACAQLKIWQDEGFLRDDFNVSINISPVQFRRKDFVLKIKNIIKRNGISPGNVMLEITEGMLIEDIDETVEKLNMLKQLGVKISIDDFGTGYSSLYYLKRLPLDEIKIDKTYVQNIIRDKDDAAIVKTIMDIARHFSLKPVAEGVENLEQENFLRNIGCETYQGYLYSKPMLADDFAGKYLNDSKIK